MRNRAPAKATASPACGTCRHRRRSATVPRSAKAARAALRTRRATRCRAVTDFAGHGRDQPACSVHPRLARLPAPQARAIAWSTPSPPQMANRTGTPFAMPIHASVLTDVTTVGIYILTMWLPGGLAAAALGVRGWQLAASAPLATYFIAGEAGPLLHAIGLRYGVVSFACCAVVVILLCGVARWLTLRRRDFADRPVPARADWLRSSHLVVAGVVTVSAAVGCYVVIRGMGWLDYIPQDWDAAFHANGIRYIADTGDGGLFGMQNINLYVPPNTAFYPNGYHLVGALVYLESHASLAAVLNANTILWPGILALSLVALVRAFRGRVTTACYTALIAVAGSAGVYENMFRGPLYPYMSALVLIPVALVALWRYLERPGFDTGTMVVIAACGLFLVHSSTLFGSSMIALP